MKILIIAPTEIPARRANTLQVMKMAQALSISGHQVRLVSPQAGLNETPDWDNIARHYGLKEPFQIDWLPTHPRLRRYDYGLRAVNLAQKWGADLVYTRLPQAAAIASKRGLATIFEIHDLPQGAIGPWLFRSFLKSRGARRLVVITQALAADLKNLFNAPAEPPFTIIAPDGIDLERYKDFLTTEAARLKLGQELIIRNLNGLQTPAIQPDQFVAGYTGNLYPGRGIELLLALAARLPDITFLIVGGEPKEIAQLQARIDGLGLKNMIPAGFVPNAGLPVYQAACNVLLMPYQQRVSASSGGDIAPYLSPMKLFEYLACERAIISSDLPVLKEVLNSDNAILLPHDDIEAWVDALQRLKTDPKYLSGLASQARQDAERYTWKERSARILEGVL